MLVTNALWVNQHWKGTRPTLTMAKGGSVKNAQKYLHLNTHSKDISNQFMKGKQESTIDPPDVNFVAKRALPMK